MKKKWMIPVIVLAVIVILAGAAVWYMDAHSLGISRGRCLVSSNGSYLVIVDKSPIVMSNLSGREDFFEGLETGDEIWIIHDGVNESYPGGTGVYFCKRLSEGSVEDIDRDVLERLTELGWYVPG